MVCNINVLNFLNHQRIQLDNSYLHKDEARISELRIDPEPWLPSGILSELNAAPPNPLLEINTEDPTNIPINHVQSSNSTQGSNFKFGEWNAKSKCIHVYPPKETKQPPGAVKDNVHLPTTVMHFVGQPVISVTIVITFPFENVGNL